MSSAVNPVRSDKSQGLEDVLDGCPHTAAVVRAVLELWPEHFDYCCARFRGGMSEFERRMDAVSELVLARTGADLAGYAGDYRWMCERFVEEELVFRRTGAYRLSTFEQAYNEVYGQPEYMSKYVRGILISQVIWEPHARAFDYFRTAFLPRLPSSGSYLEVGPGHGLFLYFAARTPALGILEAWDVSESSIVETTAALQRLGVERNIQMVRQDILAADAPQSAFDGAVISEVLEHLERPDLALDCLRRALRPGGRIFINAPVNSPAPDHIYNWSSPDAFRQFVIDRGFEIEDMELFPVTGARLETALKKDLSISCVVIGRAPG